MKIKFLKPKMTYNNGFFCTEFNTGYYIENDSIRLINAEGTRKSISLFLLGFGFSIIMEKMRGTQDA